jgi:hypothetical protein
MVQRTLLATLGCLLSLALATSAEAQAPLEDYDSVVNQAVVEFDAGSWEEARVLFRRAHEIEPSARTWRGLGLTAYELRKYVDAIAEFEAALADPRKPLTQKQRIQVQALLAKSRQFVSVYRISIEPGGADVLVDGQAAELKDGQLYLDPGTHTVVVRAAGYAEARKDLSVEAGATAELSIQLEVAGQEDDEAREPTSLHVDDPTHASSASAPEGPAAGRKRLWTWVLGGSAVAAAGAGVGLWFAAYGKKGEYDDCDPASSDCDAIADKGQTLELSSYVAYGAAGLLLGGAVAAFFLEGRSSTSRETALLLSPQGIALRGRF